MLIIILVIAVIILVAFAFSRPGAVPAESFAGADRYVIYHYTDACGSCKALTPIIDKLALNGVGRFVYVKLNNRPTPDVTGYPALFKTDAAGKKVRYGGPLNEVAITKWIIS